MDSGATRSYISTAFAATNHLKIKALPAREIMLADGSLSDYQVTGECSVTLWFQGHNEEDLVLLVGYIAEFDVILGSDWLQLHNPSIDWITGSIEFNSAYCSSNCKIQPVDSESDLEDGDEDIIHYLDSQQVPAHLEQLFTIRLGEQSESSTHKFVSHKSLLQTSRLEQLQIHRIAIRNDAQSTIELMEEDDVDTEEDFSTLPLDFDSFRDVFRKRNADKLPEHRSFDLGIDLTEHKTAPFMPMYPLSQSEHQELTDYLDENLQRGFIRESKSPAGAPILFVKKKDGTLRMCVDYRGLNKVTVKNRYPLPLINDLLDKMKGARFFSKIDLRGAYNLVRIRKGDEWKTAFRTRKGLYEYLVMPFGLANAPAAFQAMMDTIFRDCINVFAVVLLDDIGIFSNTREDHVNHINTILGLLRTHNLYAKLSKCEWFQDDIELLGHRIGTQGLSMCGDKVGTISQWPTPTSIKELQSFLGLANYYRRFISSYSLLTLPLTTLLKKDRQWLWETQQDEAFKLLKKAFTSMPVLQFPDPDLQFIIECDASDFALGSVLSQHGLDGRLHPLSFYSRKFTPPEINYEVYDKELLAIIVSLLVWRQYLLGAKQGIIIFTDHRNLVHFQTTQQLTRRQARWSQVLSEYNFVLEYRKGSLQGKPDALSRRVDYEIQPGEPAYDHQFQTVLHPDMFKATHTNPVSTAVTSDRLFTLRVQASKVTTLSTVLGIQHAASTDKLAMQIKTEIQGGTSDECWTIEDGILLYNNLVYVPESCRNQLLTLHHDSHLAGHKGVRPTIELISRNYWFPRSSSFIKQWVDSCQQCLRSKTQRRKPYGLLHPLPIATQPWTTISMDFVVKLPEAHGYDSVLVVVDRMTKMSHFIPCNESLDAPGLVELVRRHIFRLHGLPTDIISDRGVTFVSKFWRAYLDIHHIKSNLSTAYHPETDGQTERVNSTLKTYLRLYTNFNQDNWVELLDQAEFAYNNTTHSSINTTPFFANYGYHPRFLPSSLSLSPSRYDSQSALEGSERIKAIQLELIEHLTNAAAESKKYADRSRQDVEQFKTGDSVYISTEHAPSARPSQTLDYRNNGPFKIIEQINPVTYRVALPPGCKMHNVFHVCLFTKAPPNPFEQRVIPEALPIIVNGHIEYSVEAILHVRKFHKAIQFYVSWVGHAPHENTWEPAETVEQCAAMDVFLSNPKNASRLQKIKAELKKLTIRKSRLLHLNNDRLDPAALAKRGGYC